LQRPPLRVTAVALNHLGNGWLYIYLAIILFCMQGWSATRVIWSAGVSAAIAHGVYPVIKFRVQRPRPIERDPTLVRAAAPLDAFSCPSGHCMTAVAVAVPLALTFSQAILPLSLLVLLIAWARLAVAHHYPSDLLFGAVLGGGVGLPVSWYLLP